MTDRILLDAGPLGQIAHPSPHPEIASWLQGCLTSGMDIFLPEVADYEVRRNLLLHRRLQAIARLDQLSGFLHYLPITTVTMHKAAQLWAEARKRGKPTADPQALDCDVILAAQALEVGAVVATENVGHLSQFVTARHWQQISHA